MAAINVLCLKMLRNSKDGKGTAINADERTKNNSCSKLPFPLQVRKAGEAVAVAGVAAVGLFGIVALAASLFEGSSSEKKNKQ